METIRPTWVLCRARAHVLGAVLSASYSLTHLMHTAAYEVGTVISYYRPRFTDGEPEVLGEQHFAPGHRSWQVRVRI